MIRGSSEPLKNSVAIFKIKEHLLKNPIVKLLRTKNNSTHNHNVVCI